LLICLIRKNCHINILSLLITNIIYHPILSSYHHAILIQSPGSSEFNQENTDLLEQLQNRINSHFQKEIELKKQIIAIESQVEGQKLKMSEAYIQLAKDKSNTKLSSQINTWKDEKDKLESQLTSKLATLSDLTGQRKPIQQEFKKFASREMSMRLLTDYYNYYVNYLDNMSYNHRDMVYSNTCNIQSFQVKALVEQLYARDVVLKQLKDEFTKNSVNYKHEGVRDYEEFKQEPLKMANILANYPNFASLSYDKDRKHDGKEARPENTDKPHNNNDTRRKNIKLLASNNSKVSDIYGKSPSNNKNSRSYNYELTPVRREFKVNHPLKINPSKYSMKIEQFSRDVPNRSINSSFDKTRNSFYNSNNNNSLNSSGFKRSQEPFDMFDKQRNKMVKTLIRKNIFGRFRGSPYLQQH